MAKATAICNCKTCGKEFEMTAEKFNRPPSGRNGERIMTIKQMAAYAKRPSTDKMDCGYYSFALDKDGAHLGDYHVNSNSWTQWRDEHPAYINIYDNGRAIIRYADEREVYIEYDGSMPEWRSEIMAAAKAATESK